jgi:tripartite-type tricarboxylate transporter receptor subunit TctC
MTGYARLTGRKTIMTRGFVVLGLLALYSSGAAHAQPYPSRPVRVITPQTTGASMDTLVRIVTPRMSETLGQPFVVDNRGGAGGTIGIEIGARAAPDGYTLVVGAPAPMSLESSSARISTASPGSSRSRASSPSDEKRMMRYR